MPHLKTETIRVFFVAMVICIVAGMPKPFTRGIYWDSTVGVMPQAIFLHDTGMDYHRLFYKEAQYAYGGARAYPFSIYPPAQALLMAATRSPAIWLGLNHALLFAISAGCVALLFRMVREKMPELNPWLAAGVMVSQGFFLSQANAINLEMPVMLCSFLAIAAFLKDKVWRSLLWLFVGAWIKTSTLPLMLILGTVQVLRARSMGAALRGLPFFILVWGIRRAEAWGSRGFAQNDLSSDWSMQTHRLRSWREAVDFTWLSFTRVPDLVLMTGGCLVLCASVVLWHSGKAARRQEGGLWKKGVAAWRELSTRPWLLIATGAGLAALVFNLLIKINLPRYLLIQFPALLLGVFGLLALIPRRVSSALLVIWLGLNLINLHGWIPRTVFRPIAEAKGEQPEHLRANGFILERSLEWFADERLQARAVRRIEEKYPDRIVVAPWPLLHELASPWFGYVRRPVQVMASHWHSLGWMGVQQYWQVYGNAKAREGTDPRKFLWVWTDNVFSKPQPSAEGRKTLEVLREGPLFIEFYEYEDWPTAR